MKLILISWNVRGPNDTKKPDVVSDAISRWKPNILFIHESKLSHVDGNIAKYF